MAKRVIRLTESDLMRLVKKVIREQEEWSDDDVLPKHKEKDEEIKKRTPINSIENSPKNRK